MATSVNSHILLNGDTQSGSVSQIYFGKTPLLPFLYPTLKLDCKKFRTAISEIGLLRLPYFFLTARSLVLQSGLVCGMSQTNMFNTKIQIQHFNFITYRSVDETERLNKNKYNNTTANLLGSTIRNLPKQVPVVYDNFNLET